ncbi:Hypothetical predicted protein [Paramuricea clavata]|uniref:Uncharacterized protein n=1 Tax=Paramuricea clavata TaxID=317549 RepID=A0A6S7G1C3_PARCT|nr:Hypothetical predicted protein [Paramuricea clavata]
MFAGPAPFSLDPRHDLLTRDPRHLAYPIPAEEISYLKTCPLVPEDETAKEKHNLEGHKRESSESWKWEKNLIIHREKFIKLLEKGRDHPQDIKEVNDVRVCCSNEFLIGKGSDGTRVYVGLSTDGYERAVKRLPRDDCADLAEKEREVLNAVNTTQSNYVINYRFLDENSDKEWLFLITDLCEETLIKRVC